jgi:predicted alpha/beta-fold hydrolase
MRSMLSLVLAGVVAVLLGSLKPAFATGLLVESTFEAHPLLTGAHRQTIWPSFSGKLSAVEYTRQRLNTPDGDFIDLDWFPGNDGAPDLAVLVHGLGGSAQSNYIKRVGRVLVENGYRTVAINLRGASGPNRTTRVYHSGKTDDLDLVLRELAESYVPTRLVVAGFSLGGNVLLKWLGENSGQQIVTAAVAVSVPYDLSAVADRMDQGFSSVYRDFILKNLRRYLRSREADLESVIDLQAGYAAETFREYDDIVTAPLSGFDSAADYYAKSSSNQYLPRIDTPTLLIHSRDDPFMTPEIIPAPSDLSSSTTLEISNRGGHVGFVERGTGLATRFYLPTRIAGYFDSLEIQQ